MAVATPRLLALLFAVSLFLSQTNAAGPQDKPKIIIFTGTTSPGYGVKLGEIIEEDGRIDADIQIVESPDVFRLMLFFPTVKLAIISSSAEKNENLGEALEWFYQSGGGLIALGATAHEVNAITAMAVKSARILAGTYAFGGPHFFSEEDVAKIHTRPDEVYRRKVI